MTTSQGWVLLGLIGALASGLLVMTNVAFVSLRNEMRARFEGLGTAFDARFAAVDQRFESVDQRFDGVDRRLEVLDRDVQSLTERFYRDRP